MIQKNDLIVKFIHQTSHALKISTTNYSKKCHKNATHLLHTGNIY